MILVAGASPPARRYAAGYTALTIAGDGLCVTEGDGEIFMSAVGRSSEICIGIVCAGVVLAATDSDQALRRPKIRLGTLSADPTRVRPRPARASTITKPE